MDALDFSDLSEEWVSQPRSSDPPEAKDEQASHNCLKLKKSIRSARSVSNTSNVLREKPESDVNSRDLNRVRGSLREIPPGAFSGTIQHHEGVQVAAVKHATPEWKKRLLKANGKSQDLFSPIGLENMFRPPTLKTSEAARLQKGSALAKTLPSSPPQLPSHMLDRSSFSGFEDSMQLPPIRAPSQTGPKRGIRTRNGSNNSSNKSTIHHERFSPVVLSEKSGSSQGNIQSRASSAKYDGRPSSSMSDSVLHISAGHTLEEADSISLPDYSELDSEQLNLNSNFVTTKRGGFSRDGSFKAKPLTPSSYQHGVYSSLPPSEAAVVGKPLTPARKTGSNDSEKEFSQHQKSSGSPLKLFHKYDTFTNDRLNCRISQFEAIKSTETLDMQDSPPIPSPRKTQALRRKQRMSSFGDGELDKFDFTHANEDGDAPAWPGESHIEEISNIENVKTNQTLPGGNDLQPSFDTANAPLDNLVHSYRAHDFESEPKRGLDMSHKVPDPKRRRMSREGLTSDEEVNLPRPRPLIKSTSFIAGKKRKDARRGDHSAQADAEVLAERQILDPVSPFRKLSRVYQKLVGDKDAQYIDVNVATDVLADELASLALNVAEDVAHGIRKKSVTTADFFQEANLIMQHIRARAAERVQPVSASIKDRAVSRQPSVLQTELFSNDDLDRPASREGDRKPKKRNATLGTRIVSHLRKFADSDDTGLALDSSFDPLKLHHPLQSQDVDSFESDCSDIRILDPPELSKDDDRDPESGKTNSTNATNTSIPTGSSGVRNKAIIEPHKVSHLITETMGGMTFDHQRQCWVKRRSSDGEMQDIGRLASEMTEDDPFADIPDLIEHSREISKNRVPKMPSSSRPTTANTHLDAGFQSSGPAIETRATSWSTVQPSKQTLTSQERRREQTIEAALLHDGYSAASHVSSSQPRAVTITLSSPPQSPGLPAFDERHEEIEVTQSVETPNKSGWNSEAERIRMRNNLSSSMVRYAPRPLSRIDELDNSLESSDSNPLPLQHQSPKTPISRTEAQVLLMPPTNQSYVSMHLTPLPDFTIHQIDQSLNLDVQYVARKQGLATHQEIEGHFSISIKELVAKIADIEPYEPYWEQMRKLDLSNTGLVTLHMLSEFCPHLEHLKVDDSELGQLNGAPEMLRILSVRNNCLSDLTAWDHLYNLQYLDISGNQLTSLNAFTNLVHLRELKADNNQITSLDGIADLDGLLKLSLAHNSISEVDLMTSQLCRLVELDLSHNKITKFAGLQMLPVLQRLNLRETLLPTLTERVLTTSVENKLEEFGLEEPAYHTTLEYLNVSTNKLKTLDVASLQKLNDLIVDFNSITTIQGLENHKSIQRVSWRYQKLNTSNTGNSSICLNYHCCVDVRSLNLSGNRLLEFSLRERFLNLEKLDLASCGIKRLASDFGSNLPNLRFLNLNHNAIRDISPLLGIKKLSHLYMVSNRIKDFRHVPQTMMKMGKALEILDCRNNPFNVGFYLANKENAMQLVVRGQYGNDMPQKDPFQDESFLIPDVNTKKDEAYLQQIDFGTSVRRRVYEVMLIRKCERLCKLDGISVDKTRIESKDKVWDRLIALGIVKVSTCPRD